jgi:hypothetical protein
MSFRLPYLIAARTVLVRTIKAPDFRAFASLTKFNSIEMVKIFVLSFACLAVLLGVTSSPLQVELAEPQRAKLYDNAERFQGDIKLTEEQKKAAFGENVEGNSGMLDTRARWPMNLQRQVIVPYRIETRHGFSE